VDDIICRETTPYQELVVAETQAYGRMLALDGAIQTTMVDEFVYHEMITHVPLMTHPDPKRVAIIGGGDGGAVREVLKHPGVEAVYLIEIDERVVETCRQYFPTLSAQLDNPRAHVDCTDGIQWVRQARDFDVILVDSTDPVGPATGLFQPEFYQSVADALGPQGVMVAQSESPFLEPDVIQTVVQGMKTAFPIVRLYLAAIPTYPSGLWSFTLGSKGPLPGPADPKRSIAATRYWTPEVHQAAFALPRFVEDLVR
jgi:spermidine synthase